MPLNQVIQTETLEAKVKELEKALREADMEMQKVVGRMNMAQIEVAELQSDRYAIPHHFLSPPSNSLSSHRERMSCADNRHLKQGRSPPPDPKATKGNPRRAPKVPSTGYLVALHRFSLIENQTKPRIPDCIRPLSHYFTSRQT